MDKNLRDYVKRYNLLDDFIIKETVSELSSWDGSSWKQHTYSNYLDGSAKSKNGERELDVSYNGIKHDKYLHDKVYECLKQYVFEDLNFSWFDRWAGFTDIRFNRYREHTLMSEHCDHIHTIFDGQRKGIPILTVLGLLNDDYDGGDLIMFQDEKIDMKAGEIIVFPSNFLYPHRVEPVTKGTRYSFVSWVW